MIQEIFTYLTEKPLLSEARSFGHLYESISLIAKEKRNQQAWGPHREECKNFIKDHIHLAQKKDSVLVLGSGPLHEIPIEILSKHFKKVTLVDIVHLKQVRISVSHLKNIEFIEHDITECENLLRTEKMLSNPIPMRFLERQWDLVLSVNLMSQLPIHFETFIHKKLKNRFTDEAINQFLKDLTKTHFEYLKLFNTPVVLITDTFTNFLNSKEEILQTDHNYTHLSLPHPKHSWIWRVAPIPEFRKDIEIRMNVSAFILNNLK